MNNQINQHLALIAKDHETEHFVQEEREIQQVRKIIIKGQVDVVFRRFSASQMVVAGETKEAVKSVKTSFKDDTLIIERMGKTVLVMGGKDKNITQIFHGSVGCVTVGDCHISNIDMTGETIKVTSSSFSAEKVIVGIALPESPNIKIKGSGNITLLDLQQAGIKLEVSGSGDILASGQVGSLEAVVKGSGDILAKELKSKHAHLSIKGSGDITAFVQEEVEAIVMGSGDIVVLGSPPVKSKRTMGSGSIKFK